MLRDHTRPARTVQAGRLNDGDPAHADLLDVGIEQRLAVRGSRAVSCGRLDARAEAVARVRIVIAPVDHEGRVAMLNALRRRTERLADHKEILPIAVRDTDVDVQAIQEMQLHVHIDH